MKLGLYCTCGGALYGEIVPDRKAKQIIAAWRQVHSGPGHAPCDAAKAGRARTKPEGDWPVKGKMSYL